MEYKELGTSSRPRYKHLAVKRAPLKKSAKRASSSGPAPPAPPPVVAAPTDGANPTADNPPCGLEDPDRFLEEHLSSKKKKVIILRCPV